MLRHIGNPRQLRRNPLVAQFFVGPADRAQDRMVVHRLRSMVAEAMDALLHDAADDPRHADTLRRQRMIVVRCDLGGEPHKRVAAELGLERRQFYRERRRARERIAAAFASGTVVGAGPLPAVALDRAVLSLTHARSLRASGMHAAAATVLRELISQVDDLQQRVQSGALLVEVLAESGDVANALEALHTFAAIGDDSDPRVFWAWAQVDEARGRFDDAAAALRRAIFALEREDTRRTEDDDELLARSYLSLALFRHVEGNNDESTAMWSAAHRFLECHPALSPEIAAGILTLVGTAYVVSSAKVEIAASCLSRACAIAERYALPREAADVAFGMATLHVRQGDGRKAMELGRTGLALSKRVHGPGEYAWRCLNVASVALTAGQNRTAIDLVRNASAQAGADEVRRGLANAIEGSALFSMGQAEQARCQIESAVEIFRASHSMRLLGSALRVRAEIDHALHRVRDARSSIEEAAYLLTRYGYPLSRAKAVQSRAKILGTRRDAAEAEAMMSALRA